MEHKIGIPAGCIATLKIEDGFAVIIVEEKFEPKDGDFVKLLHEYHEEGKGIGIFHRIVKKDHVDNIEYLVTELHCGIDYGNKTHAETCTFGQTSIEPATDAEKQQLLDALAAEGKRWNAEEKHIEDIWQPKDGDFVTISYEGKSIIFIYKDKCKIDENADWYKSYLSLRDNGILSKNKDIIASPYAVLSKSTESEKLQLLNELAKGGKRWNADEKRIENIKFKPVYDQEYFYPVFFSQYKYMTRIWCNKPADQVLFEAGMCCKTQEEAIALLKKILAD